MEPVAKVSVGGVVENHHGQDNASLQHHQGVVFGGEVVEQLGLVEQRLLRGRSARETAGG